MNAAARMFIAVLAVWSVLADAAGNMDYTEGQAGGASNMPTQEDEQPKEGSVKIIKLGDLPKEVAVGWTAELASFISGDSLPLEEEQIGVYTLAVLEGSYVDLESLRKEAKVRVGQFDARDGLAFKGALRGDTGEDGRPFSAIRVYSQDCGSVLIIYETDIKA